MAGILATFRPSDRERSVLTDMLSTEADLVYLTDYPEEARSELIGAAVIFLTRNPERELRPGEFSLLGHVELMQLLTAGADHVDFSHLPQSMTVAGNVGAYAGPMAEHILAMTLALAKNLLANHRKLEEGEFNQLGRNRELRGKTCGILGFGGIGRATARLMRALGMQISAINTSGSTNEAVDFIGTLNDLEHVLRASDVVVISLPLNKRTQALIGKRELDWTKRDAILINVARGEIVEEQALYEHLKANPNFMAGIDAWWVEPFRHGEFCMTYPFLELPNVLGSPHNSGMVPGVGTAGARSAAENLLRYLAGEPIRGIIRREDYV